MNEDMSNLMEQINHMMKNNEIPSDIKNMIQSFTSNTSNNSEKQNNEDRQDVSSHTSSSSESSSFPEFDMATIMKMKKIMDSMKSSSDDPRANLLKSLKPYLKQSRKEKVDQYIQIFGMSKMFEILSPLGGDNSK